MASTIPDAGAPGQTDAVSRLTAPPGERPGHAVIEALSPVIDCGRYRVKRCVGDRLRVGATIFRDGHDSLRAVVRYRGPDDPDWREAPLARVDADAGGDRWSGELTVDAVGRWRWQVAAFTDPLATWREELVRKLAAGQSEISSELAEGTMLLAQVRSRAGDPERELLAGALEVIGDERADPRARSAAALEPALLEAAQRYPDRREEACSAVVELDVERERARFGSWYELFPRSWGGFEGVRAQLARFAELGFDVLYLPPIHPIGVTRRKGRNDAPEAASGDPGSPWAIGAAEGGHCAVHPELGTLAEFDRLVDEARGHGIEIALDFALQCSADHPWLREHPEWFRKRPDGTLKYAENPPKRYMDIYNFDFDSKAWRSLWEALREVMLFWIEHGVSIFRVDNPHTKPLAFWEWLIESVRGVAPETIFLSEAFTRSAMLEALAKAGFSQSYTYFTWKNSPFELREYIDELSSPPRSDYLRANLFVNTPDILSDYLQRGGPGAFAVRLLLASTLSPSYGIYSGFESFEDEPRHPGSEEYLGSEKYERKARELEGPLLGMVGLLNRLRREHRALQLSGNLVFLPVENDALLAYARRAGAETLIAVVNFDPRATQEGIVILPEQLGLPPAIELRDLLDGQRYPWRLGRNYVRLDPSVRAGHLLLAAGT
jgi:starch synthase (maltosyl-transferring)